MSYIHKNLTKSEHVVKAAKVHWSIFLPSIIFILLGGSLLGVFLFTMNPLFMVIGALLVATSFVHLIKRLFYFVSTEAAVTNKRTLAKTGLIQTSSIDVQHDKSDAIRLKQSFMDRIFGSGTLILSSTSGTLTSLYGICDPFELKKTINSLAD